MYKLRYLKYGLFKLLVWRFLSKELRRKKRQFGYIVFQLSSFYCIQYFFLIYLCIINPKGNICSYLGVKNTYDNIKNAEEYSEEVKLYIKNKISESKGEENAIRDSDKHICNSQHLPTFAFALLH